MGVAMVLLTARQIEVLQAIQRLTKDRGVCPTFRELAVAIGVAGGNAVFPHLRSLRRKGMVSWLERSARTLKLTAAGKAVLRRTAA